MNTIKGNILNESKGLIVHGCNLQGVMGAGLAKELKDMYPSVWHDYIYRYRRGLQLGDVIFTKINHHLAIASAITQEHYGRDPNVVYVDYDAVKLAFDNINTYANRYHYHIKFPLIGCGLANGDWNVISKIIKNTLDSKLDVTLFKF